MPHNTNISIPYEELKTYEYLELKPITIICGGNDTGKTTILESLYYVSKRDNNGYYEQLKGLVNLSSLTKIIDYNLYLEQPENGFDAQTQTNLGKLFADSATQHNTLVIETHSDHIFNSIRVQVHKGIIKPENVATYFLSRDKASTTIERLYIDKNGRYPYWPKGFFDEWNKSLRNLLTK